MSRIQNSRDIVRPGKAGLRRIAALLSNSEALRGNARGVLRLLEEVSILELDSDSADEAIDVLRRVVGEIEGADVKKKPPGASDILNHYYDALMLTPGGWVSKGMPEGKARLSALFHCTVDEGSELAILKQHPYSDAFARVQNGSHRILWTSGEGARACFAAATPVDSAEPFARPDQILAIFVTPHEARKSAAVLSAGKHRASSPRYPKSAPQWIEATPPRNIVVLPDGRFLAYRVYGAADAPPVLLFNAIQKCSMPDHEMANEAIACGLRLIVIERPGLGLSTPARECRYEAVAADAAYLVRGLGLKNVAIIGSASASSFALAAAENLGAVTTRVALISPRLGRPSRHTTTAFGRMMWRFAKNPTALDIATLVFRAVRRTNTLPSLLTTLGATSARDAHLLKNESYADYMIAQIEATIQNGLNGALAELRLHLSGAFVDPKRVRAPIRVWLGADDRVHSLSDTRAAFADTQTTAVDALPGAGIQFGAAEYGAVMRWIADGYGKA